VLDKGLVIQADLIVSVAGIPLIGGQPSGRIGRHGNHVEIRRHAGMGRKNPGMGAGKQKGKKEHLLAGENVMFKMQGARHSTEGLYKTWQYGRFYLTPDRLILYHETFSNILFETPLHEIRGLALSEAEASPEKKQRQELHLLLKGNRWHRLTALHI